MPDDDTAPEAAEPTEPQPTDRAQRHTEELAARIARVADEIAVSEEMVARTYDDSADLRPHAADRLRNEAEEARRFAEREREHGRRLRDEYGGEDPSGDEHGGEDASSHDPV